MLHQVSSCTKKPTRVHLESKLLVSFLVKLEALYRQILGRIRMKRFLSQSTNVSLCEMGSRNHLKTDGVGRSSWTKESLTLAAGDNFGDSFGTVDWRTIITLPMFPVSLIGYYRPQRSWGKVIFSQASVILLTGGVPGQVLPRSRYTPQTRYIPWDQLHPQTRYPPGPGTPPPQTRDTRRTRYTTSPGPGTPPEQCMLGDTGNKRAVRILLEYPDSRRFP